MHRLNRYNSLLLPKPGVILTVMVIRTNIAMIRLPGVTGCFCSVLLYKLKSTQVLDLLLGRYKQTLFPM